MPIYEFRCIQCGKKFELLIRDGNDTGQEEVRCSECGSKDVEKLFSTFGSIFSPDNCGPGT